MSVADRANTAGSFVAAGIRRWGAKLGRPRPRDVFAAGEDDGSIRANFGGWLAAQIEVERQARSSFFLVPLGLMIGIGAFYGGGLRPALALPFGALAIAFVIGGPGGGAALRRLPILAAFACLGIGLAHWEISGTDTTIFSGEATVRVHGRVLWRDRDDIGRYRYRVRLSATERPMLSRPPEIVQILVSSRHEVIDVGGRFSGLVRLRPPSGPAYPGGYDFAFAPYFAGVGAYGFGLGAPDRTGLAGEATQPNRREAAELRITRLRLAISDRIRTVIGGAEGAVAAALITGERSGIPEEVNIWLRATGLAHVLSISGFHMALVAGFAMGASRAIFAAVPGLALTQPTKKWAALAALAVSAGYLLISGFGVATQRSFIMLTVMLLAVLFDRPALTLRNVGIAATVVLIVSPHELLTASFQMSFAATAALVGCYGALSRWRAARADNQTARGGGLGRMILLFLLGLAASSLIAGAASAPYAAFHFQRVAPFGLVANMIAMPIFSFWIMPLCLVSTLAMPLGLDAPFLLLVGHGLALVFRIAQELYQVLPDRPTGLMTMTGLLVLTAALLAASFLASKLRWIALPLAAAGMLLAGSRGELPDLLIFEDGKELALLGADGGLIYLRKRPNGFISEQWDRAFGASINGAPPRLAFTCGENICRAVTRNGIRVAWTDDFEQTGRACDEADVAIVARAIRLKACRSGAQLVTLRTLRRSGSLSVSRAPGPGELMFTQAISDGGQPWNRHRTAAWPEYWRKPVDNLPTAPAAAVSRSLPLENGSVAGQ